MRAITTATFTACTRRLPALALGASTLAAALAVTGAPAASAAHTGPPSALAAELADALTMATDVAQPKVVVVDPSLWQTVANITTASLKDAEANGSLANAFEAQHLLAGCLAQWVAGAGSDSRHALGACSDELGGIDSGIGPKLLAALEFSDVSESSGPGVFDHATAATDAVAPSGHEPAESGGPAPGNPDVEGTGGTGGAEPAVPTEEPGGEGAGPQGEHADHDVEAPSPEDDTSGEAGTDADAAGQTNAHSDIDAHDQHDQSGAVDGEFGEETASEDNRTSAPQQPRTWNRPGVREFVAPSAGTVTSTMGDGRQHEGIDIANTLGAPIVAVADGEVIDAGPAQGFGLWVRIRHDDGTITTYGHNNDNIVEVGQRVRAGQKIATIGNRGNSTGPHLHFEVETPDGDKTDPQKWLTSRGASIIGVD